MTTLILQRHAHSTANLVHVFAGQSDHDLSELGYRQAELAGAYLAEHVHIDRIYSSDLPRARQTADAAAVQLGLPVITDQQIREIRSDDWSYKTYEQIAEQYPEDFALWRADVGNSRCTNGESVRELAVRIMTALERIARDHDGETVLVTTHAVPIRIAQCLMSGQTMDDMKNVPWVTNASLTTVTYENGTWSLVRISQDSFLDGLQTALPSTV